MQKIRMYLKNVQTRLAQLHERYFRILCKLFFFSLTAVIESGKISVVTKF